LAQPLPSAHVPRQPLGLAHGAKGEGDQRGAQDRGARLVQPASCTPCTTCTPSGAHRNGSSRPPFAKPRTPAQRGYRGESALRFQAGGGEQRWVGHGRPLLPFESSVGELRTSKRK
jgi:hypothetical protein